MSFPTSPSDGQVYDNYKYNESLGAWEDYLEGTVYVSGGNVGIGTTDPQGYKLYVDGSIGLNNENVYITGPDYCYKGIKQDNNINLMLGSLSDSEPRMYFYGSDNGQSDAGNLYMACPGTLSLIGNDGVSIGTTDPQGYKLLVNGTVNLEHLSFSSTNGLRTSEKHAVNYGGAVILASIYGDKETMGELYVVEVGTDKYLNGTFYKRGPSHNPVVTVVASSGLSTGANNSLGTQVIDGATNNDNIRMRSVIKEIY